MNLINRPSTPDCVIVFAKFFPMKLGQVRFIARIVVNAFKEPRMINDSQWMTRRCFIAIILRHDPTFRFVSSLRKLFSFSINDTNYKKKKNNTTWVKIILQLARSYN